MFQRRKGQNKNKGTFSSGGGYAVRVRIITTFHFFRLDSMILY